MPHKLRFRRRSTGSWNCHTYSELQVFWLVHLYHQNGWRTQISTEKWQVAIFFHWRLALKGAPFFGTELLWPIIVGAKSGGFFNGFQNCWHREWGQSIKTHGDPHPVNSSICGHLEVRPAPLSATCFTFSPKIRTPICMKNSGGTQSNDIQKHKTNDIDTISLVPKLNFGPGIWSIGCLFASTTLDPGGFLASCLLSTQELRLWLLANCSRVPSTSNKGGFKMAKMADGCCTGVLTSWVCPKGSVKMMHFKGILGSKMK